MHEMRNHTNEAGWVKNEMVTAYYFQIKFLYLEHYFKTYPLRKNGQGNDYEDCKDHRHKVYDKMSNQVP